MDLLGVGVPELIAIIIIALIFIGPRDMPRMAARAAKFLRDLRMMSEGFTTEWRREINAVSRVDGLKELKDELDATKQSIHSIGTDFKKGLLDDPTSNAKPVSKSPPAAPPPPSEPKPAETPPPPANAEDAAPRD